MTITDDSESAPLSYKETSFSIASIKPYNIAIWANGEALVTISAADGALTYGPNYTPDAAARAFWNAVSGEYREMLAWKAMRAENK